MKSKNMQKEIQAGNLMTEMEEIKKMQRNPDTLLTLWSNTCAEFRTIICC